MEALTLYSADEKKIIEILKEYGIPLTILVDDEPKNDEEILLLMNVLYQAADNRSPTGTRTPADTDRLMKIQKVLEKVLENNLKQRQQQTNDDLIHINAWQAWAERERKKTDQSLEREKLEKIEKMNRLQEALKNPNIRKLLNKGQRGGKSCVFRRKNKKMTSTSRRNMRSKRRRRNHRKSSTRRSMRK
jgi:hypothetical protein